MGMQTRMVDVALDDLRAGRRAAIARAITEVENEGPDAPLVLAAIAPLLGRARVVGVTGAPGAGKSTLVSALIDELRRRGERVAVVAVDPSSPFTGGAILGDRVRMTRHAGDDGVFVRSLASRGHLGGLTRTAARVVDVLDAAGFPWILIETVGAGQNEVEVAEIADCRIVVCAPALGDEVQAIKAGVLEIADLLVVNKADLPLAERTARQLAAFSGQVPVLRTVALRGTGVAELADAIAASPRRAGTAPEARTARLIEQMALERVRARLDRAALARLSQAVLRGELSFDGAAARLLAPPD
jgi:LAO/AO transport system ATPase